MKIGKMMAAVCSAAIILGGAVMLVGDEVKQEAKNSEIQPYTISADMREQLDSISQELSATEFTEAETLPEEETNFTEIMEETTETFSETLPEQTLCELKSAAQNLINAFPDAIGWLYLPDTAINYPLMQGKNNDFYLHHAYDGSNLASGAIFLDYRCENRLRNGINIVYGHNMKNGSMFAGLKKFSDDAFFQAHRFGWLVTETKVYRIDFFSLANVNCHDAFYDGSQPLTEWMPRVQQLSTICKDMCYAADDHFISLSTCTNAGGESRTVLTGRLVEME